MEAKHYYHGLYSEPVLIARTGSNAWVVPSGPEAFLRPNELGAVSDPALSEVWEGGLAFRIHEILEANTVRWTTTDVVRIGFVGECTAPVVLWIGVTPDTLSHGDGQIVAKACKELLAVHNINDIEVEIREANVIRYISPKLKKPASSVHPTAQIIQPLTPTSGLTICNSRTPALEGTGGFFVSDRSSLYLVTARHVVFNTNRTNNHFYKWKLDSEPIDIALFGTCGFEKYLTQIEHAIKIKNIAREFQGNRVKAMGEQRDKIEDEEFELVLTDAAKQFKEAVDAIVALEKLLKHVKQVWGDIASVRNGAVRPS